MSEIDKNIDENEELDNIILLNDENGNEVPFEFLDLVEYKDREFIVLLPADDETSGEVVILEIQESENDDEETYVSVDDEATLEKVFEIFKDKFKDEFDFVD